MTPLLAANDPEVKKPELSCPNYLENDIFVSHQMHAGDAMNLADLNKVAQAMVAPGKGILAADESSGTIKKRFDAIGVTSTEDSRRDYREMMFRAHGRDDEIHLRRHPL